MNKEVTIKRWILLLLLLAIVLQNIALLTTKNQIEKLERGFQRAQETWESYRKELEEEIDKTRIR